MEAEKSCPVVLRGRETLEILAFEHPLAGFQLVKGSVEPGESTDLAAVRELKEEAGIQSTVGRHLGERRSIVTRHTWAFLNVMLTKTFLILGCILQKMMEAMNSDSFGILS